MNKKEYKEEENIGWTCKIIFVIIFIIVILGFIGMIVMVWDSMNGADKVCKESGGYIQNYINNICVNETGIYKAINFNNTWRLYK